MSAKLKTAHALLLVVFGGLLCAPAARAQSILDARRVEFTPSADHAAVDASGAAVVQSYTLDVLVSGAAVPVQSVNIGKPSPDPDGMIRLDFVSRLASPLTAGVTYEAVVSAIGPGGTSSSLPSNTFGFSALCAPSLSAVSQGFSVAGGSGSVAVTAGPGCAWTAASNVSWLTITNGGVGVSNGGVGFAVAATTSTSTRTGTLTIAGTTFTVTQSGANPPCAFTLSSVSQALPATGGSGSVAVTAGAGCGWTAVSNNTSWLSVSSGASGSGSGSVAFTVAPRTSTSSRSGTLTIAGSAFSVTQVGTSGCAYALSPASLALPSSGGAVAIAVTAGSGCAWTASSNASWATVLIGANGSANGKVSLSVNVNTTTSARTATVTIAGETATIAQSAPCSFAIAPASLTAPASGVTATATVTTQAGCSWSVSTGTSWLNTTGARTGSGSVSYTVTANQTASSRMGTLVIAGQSVVVTQASLRVSSPAGLRILGSR